jgi:hypothetical protein
MLSELIRAVYDSSAMDWATAEKVVYTMLTYMERKLPPELYTESKKYMLGYAEYQMPDRSAYPGYAEEVPSQVRDNE